MGRNKGPNSKRRRCNPRTNRRSRAQHLRRAKEQIINKSFQDCLQKVTSMGFIPTRNTEIKKPSEGITNSFHSFQDCSQKLTSKDFMTAGNRNIQHPAKENSNLSVYLPLTTVVNSEPVTRPPILEPSIQNQKKLLMHGISTNKSCGTANRCRPRSYATRKSKAQRLRRVKEKDLIKTCGKYIDKSFQDSSQAMISIDSTPSKRMEILDPSEGKEKCSYISPKVTIIDSVPVIKTEILDPSEINKTLIFQNYSQCATTMSPIPIVKTEILDLPRENGNCALLNIKVEQSQISNTMGESSKIEGFYACNINNKNSSNIEKTILETYPKYHLLKEYSLLPCPPGSFKAKASRKKKSLFVLNHKVHPNKIVKKKHSSFSRTVCDCLEKIAMKKQLCENYLEEVKQDYANQLCLCKIDVHSLSESKEPDEKLLKTFCLENPEFGKITCNLKTR